MQVKSKDDMSQFADKFRNYSKDDGHEYRKVDKKRFVLRRKNKIYCPNCKAKNNLNSIYCKECGSILESISKRTYDFSIRSILSKIDVKDSLKVAGFAVLILFAVCLIIKQILGMALGDYASYVSAIDILLLINGGNLDLLTNANSMMNYGSYYSLSFQICTVVSIMLAVISIMISYNLFSRQKNSNELVLFRQAIGVGIVYGVILAVLAILSKNSISIGGGFLSSGYSLVYGFSFVSVLSRGVLLGFLSTLYIGIKREYEDNNIYLSIFKFVIKTICLGYLIILVFLVLGHFIGLRYIYEFGISNSVSNINIFAVLTQLAAYIWGFANLNFVTIGGKSLFLGNLFSTSLSIDFKLCLVAFVALSALILFVSGLKLSDKYKNSTNKPVLIFSVIYAIMMGGVAVFTSININGGTLIGYNLQMGISLISTLIISFIYSFIVTFIGFKLNNWD